MKGVIVIILIFLSLTFSYGQRSYDEAIDKGNKAVKNKQFKKAINLYFAAEAFDLSKKESVKTKVNSAFDSINKLKEEAVISEESALREKKNAERSREIAIKNADDALSYKLIWKAKNISEDDPTLALRLAEAAAKINSKDLTLVQEQHRIYNENTFYKIIISDSTDIDLNNSNYNNNFFYNRHYYLKVLTDNKTILYGDLNQNYHLLNLEGKKIKSFGLLKYLEFSPNENIFLALTESDEIKLWDSKGNQIEAFNYPNKNILWAKFLPGGESLITWSRSTTDDIFRVLSLKGEVLHEKKFNSYFDVVNPEFSPNEKIFFMNKDLYDLDGNLIKSFDQNTKSLTFSSTGDTVFSVTDNRKVSMWDSKGNFIKDIKKYDNEVLEYLFTPDRRIILTFFVDDTDGNVRLKADLFDLDDEKSRVFDLASRVIEEKVAGEDKKSLNDLQSYEWSPDGNKILIQLARYSNQHGREIRASKLVDLKKDTSDSLYYEYDVQSSIFSPDGNTILSTSEDGAVRLWNLKGERLEVFKGHTDKVTSAAFFPNGKTIITVSQDKTVRLWDLKGLSTKKGLIGHTDKVQAVAISNNGLLATGSDDKSIRLWNLNGDSLRVLEGHEKPVWSLAFSPNGKYLLSGSMDSTVRLWDMHGKDSTRVFAKHDGAIHAVAFSPTGDTILTGSHDATARLWDLKGNILKELKNTDRRWSRIHAVAYSPDGKKILTGHWDDAGAILWDLEGNPIKMYEVDRERGINSITFSPDSKSFLYGTWEGRAFLRELNGDTIMVKKHNGAVNSVTFSPSGKSFSTAIQEEMSFNVWDLQGKLIQKFIGHEGQMNSVTFSSDGKFLVTGSNDNTAIIWEVSRSLEDFLENGNIEELTEQQIEEYGIQAAMNRIEKKE